jgi:hypothetical protein
VDQSLKYMNANKLTRRLPIGSTQTGSGVAATIHLPAPDHREAAKMHAVLGLRLQLNQVARYTGMSISAQGTITEAWG